MGGIWRGSGKSEKLPIVNLSDQLKGSNFVLIVSDKIIFLFTSVMTQALRVLTAFAMARLLKIEDYGLITLVSLAPGFISVLGDCGVARALVQYRDMPAEKTEATGLIISMALGVVYTLVWLGSGLFCGIARHDPRLFWVAVICGTANLLSSIYTFQMACLNRDLKFKAESFQNITFAAALTVTGLSMALIARRHREVGVFALALQPLVAQILGNLVIFHRHPFRWPKAFSGAMAKKMLNYGWKVTVAQYAVSLPQSIVNTFVIIVAGPWGAGVFGRATQVSDMIGYNLLSSFDRLLHPLLRSVREDKNRLRTIFTRGCIGGTLLCGFGWAWLVGTAPDLVRVVLGPQWSAVPPLLRIVCTVLLTSGAGLMGAVVTHALGKPLVLLLIAGVNVACVLLAFGLTLLLHRSLTGIAVAYILCQIGYCICLWVWAVGTIKIPARRLIGHFVRIFCVAGATCASIFWMRHWMMSSPVVLRLIAESLVGAGIFLGLGLLVDSEAILDFRSLVSRRQRVQPEAVTVQDPGEVILHNPIDEMP
jgi:PST family polysaccharide transporter